MSVPLFPGCHALHSCNTVTQPCACTSPTWFCRRCTAVVFEIYVPENESARWLNCRKVVGVETVGVFLRTMTRAVTTRQAFPDLSQG